MLECLLHGAMLAHVEVLYNAAALFATHKQEQHWPCQEAENIENQAMPASREGPARRAARPTPTVSPGASWRLRHRWARAGRFLGLRGGCGSELNLFCAPDKLLHVLLRKPCCLQQCRAQRSPTITIEAVDAKNKPDPFNTRSRCKSRLQVGPLNTRFWHRFSNLSRGPDPGSNSSLNQGNIPWTLTVAWGVVADQACFHC
jgi:hypothetical protein